MRAVILIRILVGWVFVSEGIQKFLFPDALGAGRFAKIGIPLPQMAGPLVGFVEIIFGTLVIVGLFTRLAAIPLLAVILTAIATTKIPMLHQGVWPMLHEARVDFSMLLGLLFLLIAGPGAIWIDGARSGVKAYRAARAERRAADEEIVPARTSSPAKLLE
jgi:putative oxidoreductase